MAVITFLIIIMIPYIYMYNLHKINNNYLNRKNNIIIHSIFHIINFILYFSLIHAYCKGVYTQ